MRLDTTPPRTAARQVGQTPPALLQSLLRLDVGKTPHVHSLVCSASSFGSSPSNKQKEPTQFYCLKCYSIYSLLLSNDALRCRDSGGPNIHHLHLDSSILLADNQSNLRLYCCRCPYEAHFIKTAPAISMQRMRLIELDKPNYQDRIKFYNQIIKITTNILNGEKRPLKKSNPLVDFLLKGLNNSGQMIFDELEFTETSEGFMVPPNITAPSPSTGSKDKKSRIGPLRERIEDIRTEMSLAMYNLKLEFGLLNNNDSTFIDAHLILLQLLGCDTYEKDTSYQNATESELKALPPPPPYGILGCTPDMADYIIVWAYERCREEDPHRSSEYFNALIDVAEMRNSDMLEEFIKMNKSQGAYSAHDVKEAYQKLELHNTTVPDETVISIYASRVADKPKHKNDYKKALRIIGRSRGSETIAMFLEKSNNEGLRPLNRLTGHSPQSLTVKDAYAYFGINEMLSDEFIVSVYEVAKTDRPNQQNKQRECLKLIAQSRNSNYLMNVLAMEDSLNDGNLSPRNSGNNGSTAYRVGSPPIPPRPMLAPLLSTPSPLSSSLSSTNQYTGPAISVNEAYQALQIEDKGIDDDMLLTVYQIHADDGLVNPRYRECLRVIGQNRQSQKILKYLDPSFSGSFIEQKQQNDINIFSDLPVGLVNIGNTCFLNSLLQYYATITDLRTAVINFNEHNALCLLEMNETQQDTASDQNTFKTSSAHRISPAQQKRAIQFTAFLGQLYREMMVSSGAVRPSIQLAQMALTAVESEDNKAIINKQKETTEMVETETSNAMAITSSVTTVNTQDNTSTLPRLPPRPMYTEQAQSTGSSLESINTATDTIIPDTVTNIDLSNSISDSSVPDKNDPMEDIVVSPPFLSSSNMQEMDHGWKTPPLPSTTDSAWLQPTIVKDDTMAISDVKDTTVKRHSAPSTPQNRENSDKEVIVISDYSPKLSGKTVPSTKGMTFGKQEDVTECMNNMMDLLSIALAPNMKSDNSTIENHLIKQIFYGKTKQSLSYLNSQTQKLVNHDKEEEFSHIIFDAEEGKDIYDGMDKTFGIDLDQVNYEGHDAQRQVWISRLPPVLQFQLQRVQYDREQQKAFKSNAYLKLEPSIYMDRYLASNAERLMHQHQQYYESRKRMAFLKQRIQFLSQTTNGLTTLDILHRTIQILEQELQMTASDSSRAAALPLILDGLRHELNRLMNELTASQTELDRLSQELRNVYQGLEQVEYRLHAVFMHRGQASYGHYWIYIYDWEGQRWLKYNDDVVTEVSYINLII
ncbi:hypothetical protein BDF19DRAFT_432702 [Syncephalis fuscata]|nr:hypothetical protein BDF19DRAFT_432702 [Syncephalis fuscata]